MPQVPYKGYPEGGPPDVPHKPEVPGAFRDAARAVTGLGKDISGAGEDIWRTAVQMRQLEIEAEVNEAVTKSLVDTGELDNTFRRLEGKDAQEKLPEHVSNLRTVREGYRKSLSGPYAQKMFDRETMRRMGYDIINAGNYAATNMKQYTKATRKATQVALADRLASDPNNEQLQTDTMNDLVDLEIKDSLESGDSKEMRDAKVKDTLGRTIDHVASVLSKTDPDAANRFLDRWKDYMHGAQLLQTQEKVRERSVKVFAEMESARIASGPQIEQVRRAVKGIESGGKAEPYKLETTTKNPRTGKTQTALGAYQVMEENLPEWSKAALGREVSKEEFLANPAIQDAIFDHRMGIYLRKYGPKGAGEAWFGGEGAVGKESKATDAFGKWTVASYGRAIEGAVTPGAPEEYNLAQQHQAVEESADRLGQKYNWDPVTRQQFIDQTIRQVDTRASAKQREVRDRMRVLTIDVGQTMNKQFSTGRGPISTSEGNQLDPRFQEKVEELEKLNPGFARRLDNWFKSNAKQDVPWSVEREAEFAKFLGATDEDRAKYKPEEMFNNGQITRSMFNRMMETQAGIQRKTQMGFLVDPILLRNHQALNDAMAFPSRVDAAANERYKWLRGAAQLRMEKHIEEKKAMMTYKEQDEMMKSLLEEVVTGKYDWYDPRGWLGGAPQAPRFETEGKPPTTINSAAERDALTPGSYYFYKGQLSQKPYAP